MKAAAAMAGATLRRKYAQARDAVRTLDSLTQLVLGASVGKAIIGRATRPARAAAWGAVAGTVPGLDVLIGSGDPILEMALHRAESQAFLWLTRSHPAGVERGDRDRVR